MRYRRGLSMLDLALLLTGSSFVLGLSTQVIHHAMEISRDLHRNTALQRDYLRLSHQFDVDACQSKVGRVNHEDKSIDFIGPQELIRYMWTASRVERVVRRTDEDKAVQRESYSFPSNIEFTITTPEDGSRQIVVEARRFDHRVPLDDSNAMIVFELRAQVGYDLRFSPP